MEHQCAEHDIELPITKRQRLCDSRFKSHVDSGPRRFGRCTGNHRRRCVDADDSAACADHVFRDERHASGSTSHIEDRFTRREVRQVNQPLAERATSSMREQPHERVVLHGALQDAAGRRRWGIG